jgi:hypothetical protein
MILSRTVRKVLQDMGGSPSDEVVRAYVSVMVDLLTSAGSMYASDMQLSAVCVFDTGACARCAL